MSSPVNYNFSTNSLILFAWAVATGTVATEFKVTQSGSSLAFRQSPAMPAAPNAQPVKWKVFPNPASDLLTITNGTGADEATHFRITDMEGCMAMEGRMTGGRMNINIHNLVPGSYMVELYNGDHSCGNTVFVKY